MVMVIRLVTLMILLCGGAFAKCDRTIQRPEYSVCAPSGWQIDLEQDPTSPRTIVCKVDAAGRCLRNKDIHPYRNVLVVDINAADGLHKSNWITSEEAVSRARRIGGPTPDLSEITLLESRNLTRGCWLVRAFEYGDLWVETYGLTVNGHRFLIRAFYNDEPVNIRPFRSDVLEILQSITPTK
jgi:hypothetical protein